MIERRTAHAGTFYPADPRRLGVLVDTLLGAAASQAVDLPGLPLGLLVPHAGLMYSGAIAAAGWLALAGACSESEPPTIVLVGTDHEARAGASIAVWTGGPWRSPIGSVEVDQSLARRIVALGPPFAADDVAHLGEHSLEVQLPFLATALPAARIVPLLVSPLLRDHAEAGERLGALMGELAASGRRLALAASSDFAHYPPDAVAREVDGRLLEPILRLDHGGLVRVEREVLAARHPGLACGLCGIDPVRVALVALAAMGARRGVLLGAATSAQAGGDPRRTVGYASVAFVA